MQILKKEEVLDNLEFYIGEFLKGKVFIYPTDTIYGIGCDANIEEAVGKIRDIKKRDEKPFSVIAPHKEWIIKNCFIDKNAEKWLDKLPGTYTLILELRNWDAVTNKINFGSDHLGIRIPEHWFSEVVKKYGTPFVTTSVNIAGEPYIKQLSDLNEDIKEKVDYFIDCGYLTGTPSTIVKLINGGEEIVRRV